MKIKALFALGASLAALSGVGAQAQQSRAVALSQGEVQQAAQQHPQVIAQFGGELDAARSAYVRNVGSRITAQTNVAGGAQAFRVTALNSPVMNAFAVPGGYLYFTRQLMALMNNEAELASVIGHEAGHVAAQHGQRRQQTGILSQLGALIVGAVTGSGQLAQAAGALGQSYLLSYSRGQELQADDLGVQYMARAGYDPSASATLLTSLGAWSALETRFQGREDDQRSTPSWARTHPLSSERVTRSVQQAQRTGRVGGGTLNGSQYLAMLDGMIFDDDPAQGIVEGSEFRHPDLRLAFTAPQGFGIQNGTRAVTVVGSSGQAQFSTGPFNGDLTGYIAQVFQSMAGANARIAVPQPQRTTINGLPAAVSSTRAQTQQGSVDVTVVAYAFDDNSAYHFMLITPAGRGIGPFSGMVQSLRRLSAQEAGSIRPRVIDIVTVRQGDTVQTLASRMAYRTYQLERFRVLNGIPANGSVRPGQQVKLVVYSNRA